ncbi:hypothetical protein SAMN04489724_2592 [Algoriphagus locisalis]|uniref:Uncharacterized protein n=1 Tax=Algoriphagus locisalis TaxID=305507 RepID=A0A1I7BPI6_9BACT|nr:hypothetical protein SAMN04489724_2592 [Algoriphagus locisalis]
MCLDFPLSLDCIFTSLNQKTNNNMYISEPKSISSTRQKMAQRPKRPNPGFSEYSALSEDH